MVVNVREDGRDLWRRPLRRLYSIRIKLLVLIYFLIFFCFGLTIIVQLLRARYFSLFPIPFCFGSDLSSAATKGVYTRDDGSDFFSSAACTRHFMGF